ncbi:MAG: transposase [Syntrophales bacterium]
MIPWDVVERRHAEQFKSPVGNPAYPVRVAFGALVIKEKLKITDGETVGRIRENPYLQYFIGYKACSDRQPFNSSTMVYFRIRLSADILKEINALIIEGRKRKNGRMNPHQEKIHHRTMASRKGRRRIPGHCLWMHPAYPKASVIRMM